MSGLLRILPLGGVGEIGKNMTVVEYDGRIVVVDCGLRFPTAEMMGIDLVLPDRSGAVLARALRRRRPDLGVLYVSGYGDPDPGDREPGVFLAKPFTAAQLSEALQTALETARSQATPPPDVAEGPRADLA